MKQQIAIKTAVVIGNTITLECSPTDCDKARAVIDEGKPLAAVIGTASQKRSLSANAYAWALMNQLAAKINRPVLDIYRDLIRDIGGSSALVTIRADAAKAFKNGWEPGGVSKAVAVITAERFMYEQRRRVAVLVKLHAEFIAGLHRLSVLSTLKFLPGSWWGCPAAGIPARSGQ